MRRIGEKPVDYSDAPMDDTSLLQNEFKAYVPRRRRCKPSRERKPPHLIMGVAAFLLLSAVIVATILGSRQPQRRSSNVAIKREKHCIVAARLNGEDTGWLQTYFGNVPSTVVSAVDIPVYRQHCPRGREDLWEDDCQTHVAAANGGAAAAYLQWIVSHYYQLPSAVAFIHDHGKINRHLLKHLKWDASSFISLQGCDSSAGNCSEACQKGMGPIITPRHPTDAIALNPNWNIQDQQAAVEAGQSLQTKWSWFQGALGNLPPEQLRAPGCHSEMIVAAERITARPVQFWTVLLSHLTEVSTADKLATSLAFEAIWHVLFGEPYVTVLMNV